MTIIILLTAQQVFGQTNTLHGTIQTNLETVAIGIGGTYIPSDWGIYGIISADLSHKANHSKLETGVGAEIARELSETGQQTNWAQLNIGPTYRISDGYYIVVAPGFSVFADYTQHANEYWVQQDTYTELNVGAGLIMVTRDNFSLNFIAFSNPGSVSVGVGYIF